MEAFLFKPLGFEVILTARLAVQPTHSVKCRKLAHSNKTGGHTGGGELMKAYRSLAAHNNSTGPGAARRLLKRHWVCDRNK